MTLGRKSLYKYIYYFIIAFIVISGFTDLYFVWHLTILAVFAVAYLFKVKPNKTNRNFAIPVLLVITFILFTVSLLCSRDLSALSYNLRSSLYSLCGIGILYLLNRNKGFALYKDLFKLIKIFNFILIINLFVLSIQTRGTGFLIRSSWLATNPYYEDHCAGLFGFNATNVLGLYSIFVMMLNLSYAQTIKKHRKGLVIYTLLTQAFMAFLSQYNDNTGFYMLLITFLAVFAYSTVIRNNNISKRVVSFAKYFVLILILFIVAINLPVLGDYIKVKVFDKIQRVLFYDSFGGASGGSERLAIVRYALGYKSTWLFGTGVGATQWIQDHTFGFRHFGIDSMGSYIMLGGIWFYLAYTSLYTELYYSLFSNNKKEKYISIRILIFMIVVLFTLYTTVFNDARTAVLIGMIAIVIRPMIVNDSDEMSYVMKSSIAYNKLQT